MSGFMVSLIFAIGSGAWVFNKSQRQTGGLTQKSLLVAGVAGVIAFIVFFTLTMTLGIL